MDFLKAKPWTGQTGIRYVEEKLDGHRVCFERSKDGLIRAHTRVQGTDLWPKLREFDWLAELGASLPLNSAIDGELHIPFVQATSIKTLINEICPALLFTPFAIPIWEGRPGKDIGMEEFRDLAVSLGQCPPETESPLSFQPFSSKVLKEEAIRRKLEGFVLKVDHYEGWYKLKPTRTVDAFVWFTSTSQAPTRFGGLEAIYVAVYTMEGKFRKIARVASGFDHDWRMNVDPYTLKGRVAEIEYDDLAANGMLKFPRFKRWRDDEKLPEECLEDQLQ